MRNKNGSTIKFQAGEKIHLYKGFHAEAGSSFKACVSPEILILSNPTVFEYPLCYDVVNVNSGWISVYSTDSGDTTFLDSHIGYFVDENTMCFGNLKEPTSPPTEYMVLAFFSNNCHTQGIANFYPLAYKNYVLTDSLTSKISFSDNPKNELLRKSNFKSSNIQNKTHKHQSLSVYPNPTKDVINFELDTDKNIISISIIDNFGNIVDTFENINKNYFLVDISTYNTGIYFSSVLTKSNHYFTKIVKIE